MSDLVKMIGYATLSHTGQMYDRLPYAWHLDDVAQTYKDLYEGDELGLVVCWGHDLMEDTDVSYMELAHLFGEEVADAIGTLTFRPTLETRKMYLENIKKHPLALKVKICDTIANLNRSISGFNLKRIAKYSKQLTFLLEED
jgi:(p)ppGpp synthase/HD superfamily hydrolase